MNSAPFTKAEFMAATRGVPACTVARALLRQVTGIDFRGCSKEHIASTLCDDRGFLWAARGIVTGATRVPECYFTDED